MEESKVSTDSSTELLTNIIIDYKSLVSRMTWQRDAGVDYDVRVRDVISYGRLDVSIRRDTIAIAPIGQPQRFVILTDL